MIKLSVSVEMTDGRAGTYPVTPRVQVDFEREFKSPMIAAFAGEPRMEHIYWLGWRAMHAAGEVVKPFDKWLEDVESVMPDGVPDVPLDQQPN